MTIKKDLELFGIAKPNPYEQYFLLDNPFPAYGEQPQRERADVCTDQQPIKENFVNILRNFGPGAKRLRINGESGAGKTNILYYFELLTEEARRSGRISAIYPIYVCAPGDSYFDIHEQIVEKLAELFLGDLTIALQTIPDLVDTLSAEIKPAAEVLAALKAIVRPRIPYAPYEERQKNVFILWLKGHKLPARDKRLLEDVLPLPEINSASLAIRFLSGLLQVLKRIELCDGIILLFDEFEEIFEGLTRTRHSRYAQDLRHLFDVLQELVFFVVATIPEPRDLGQYPAIERRLGNTMLLQPIGSVDTAIGYARDYLRAGHERYFRDRRETPEQGCLDALDPLTPEIIAQEYQMLETEVRQAERDVLPGYFLPRMRQRMQNIVKGN